MTGDMRAAAGLEENMRTGPSSVATDGSAGQCGAPCCLHGTMLAQRGGGVLICVRF